MFARAVEQHQTTSIQPKSSQKFFSPTVQKTIDFTGAKRKALDVIDESNKRIIVESTSHLIKQETKSTLITALTNTDSFNDTNGLILLDGEPFDEADFEDIGIDDWDHHSRSMTPLEGNVENLQSNRLKNDLVLDQDDLYFDDCDDLDWDAADLTKPIAPPIVKSSPPNVPPPATQSHQQTAQEHQDPQSIQNVSVQDKENESPPPEPAPADTAEPPLSKVLFPSSDSLPWSSSPIAHKAPTKRSLPWLTNPKRYAPPPSQSSQHNIKNESKIKSLVHKQPQRGLSTLTATEQPVDWGVLGISERDIFERTKRDRLEQLRQSQEAKKIEVEQVKKATEWIDKPVSKATEGFGRRKKREETKMLQKKVPLPDKRPVIAQVFLSQEQLSVRKLVVEDRQSVFFTGSAGTGKSVLLREIISGLKKAFERNPEAVAVTASTGLAACNVGGITLHSFAAFGLGKEPVPELARKVKKNKKCSERWRRTKVLIIDEISMVDATLFDKLEALARILRKDNRPFGGIQLVVTGDFFQLPPVPDYGREAKFTFEAEKWKECIPHTIKLTSVFRQKDQEFVTMLNEMRLGGLSADSISKFKALQRPLQFNDNIEPTELFPTREEVDYANNARMRALPGSLHAFHAEEGGAITDLRARGRLLQNCMAPQIIELKKDVQVMLIKNMDENLVNGSLGKVIGFMSESTYSLCEREGIDLDSALNFDAQVKDDPFGFKTLEGEDDDSESVLRKKRRILKLRAMAAETSQLWPLVRFTTASGYHIDRLMTREKWSIETPDGEVQAYRRQIPLILAYAISIHKAQGQTLSRVRVDLGKVFEKGQAYVALSRATSREGLQILRFDAKRVMAHPKVAGFYRSLEGVDQVSKKDHEMPKKNDWVAKALEKLMDRDDNVDHDEEEALYAYG